MQKEFIISLGGSIIYPGGLDEKVLKKFCDFILKATENGYKFVIIAGGGKLCRNYQAAARNIANPSDDDLDWLGISATHLNALLLKTILRKSANPELLDAKGKIKNFGKYKIVVGCGRYPGWSTDFIAVNAAIDFKIKTILNLSNISFVYTTDPKKDKKALPIKQLSWNDYFKTAPKKRIPGMNTPFDPVASHLAQKQGIKVIVANGRDLSNLHKIIYEQNFKGTIIE